MVNYQINIIKPPNLKPSPNEANLVNSQNPSTPP